MKRFDPDIETKVRASIRFINDTIQDNANQPSVAFYRIQEHVHRTLPIMIQKRYELENFQEEMNGLVFDIDYSIDAVKDLRTSDEHITNIITHLEKALYVSKQINIFRQKQIQQQLFEKNDEPLLMSLRS